MEARVESQELRGRVHGPAGQDEESVEWPEGFRVRTEEFKDDSDGVDDAAEGAEEEAPIIEAAFAFEDAVDAQVDVEREV